MNFLQQIHRVSEFLFLVTGLSILVAFLLYKHSYLWAWEAEVFLQLIDQPFCLFAIIFGMTSLRISFTHQHYGEHYVTGDHHARMPILDILLWLIALGSIGGYAYFDLFVTSVSSFPLLLS